MDRQPYEPRCIVARQYQWIDYAGRERWCTSSVNCKVKDADFWIARGYVVVFREPEPIEQFNPPRLLGE